MADQVERPNPKFLLRGEDRSSLNILSMHFCHILSILLKKRFGLSTRVWVSVLGGPKLLSRGQTLGAKSVKKCYHVGILEAFHLWSLATSVKA